MAKRAKGEGSYIHIVPQNCKTCPEFKSCKKAFVTGTHCAKRDKVERWAYQYVVRTADGSKKRKCVYARTRKDLQTKVEQLLKNPSAYKTEATVGEWGIIWIKSYLPKVVRQSTEMFYVRMLQYIPEKIKKKQISKVTPADLQQLLQDLLEHGGKTGQGLSTSTVRSVRSTLITLFEHAMDNGYVASNPAKKTKPPRLVRKKLIALTKEEAARLQKVADTGEYYKDIAQCRDNIGTQYLVTEFGTLIRLALASGARRGELFGLAWDDVDFLKKRIHVVNNLQKGVLSAPKTRNSERFVSLDIKTMERLQNWKKYQKSYQAAVGDLYINKQNLVFTNINGSHINVDNFRIRYFNKMCRAANLPAGTTLHSLRHTHATLLLQAGENPKIIADRLGHATVSFMMNTYISTLKEMAESVADVVGEILS